MAKKKEPKVIRARYQAGDPRKKGTISEKEGFYLEAWCQAGEGMPWSWTTICFAECHRSVNFPDSGTDFIHFEILQRIAEWVRMGYTFYYGTRETTYLDEREKEEWAKYNESKKNY